MAFPLGIIKANLKNYNVWIASKYINCIYGHQAHLFDIIDDDIWCCRDGLTEIQTISIKPEVFSHNLIDLIGLIKFMLKSNYYLIGNFNEYYIPRKKPYKEFDFIHDYVLFGYNDSEAQLKSAGYIDTQKYEKFDIGYANYLESIYKMGSSRVDLCFYRINTDFEVKFDIELVAQHMKDYINSRCSTRDNNDYLYGISAWDMLAKYIQKNEKPFLDLRYTRVFMEHKSLMFSRLNVLLDKGYLHNKDMLEQYCVEIVEQARLIHHMCLKYNLSHNTDIVDRTYDIIKAINQKEYNLLRDVINSIS